MTTATKLPMGSDVLLDGKPGKVTARYESDNVSFLLVARPSGTEIWVPERSDRVQPQEDS